MTPSLILRTLLHVREVSASKPQKLISYTSDVADMKVIATGEPTIPSLVDKVFPSINNFFAGSLHVHELLREQPVTLQGILREPVDLDNLGTGNDKSSNLVSCPQSYAWQLL